MTSRIMCPIKRNGTVVAMPLKKAHTHIHTHTHKKCINRYRLTKLTTSLINVSLKFQMLISEICQHVLLEKYRSFFIAKASLIF